MQVIGVNKPKYLEDFASGSLDTVRLKYVAYSEGQIMRDEQKKIIFGETRDKLYEQLPKDRLYFIAHVGTVDLAPGESFKRRN